MIEINPRVDHLKHTRKVDDGYLILICHLPSYRRSHRPGQGWIEVFTRPQHEFHWRQVHHAVFRADREYVRQMYCDQWRRFSACTTIREIHEELDAEKMEALL